MSPESQPDYWLLRQGCLRHFHNFELTLCFKTENENPYSGKLKVEILLHKFQPIPVLNLYCFIQACE